MQFRSALVLALALVAGFYLISQSIVRFKTLERAVSVKGLAEKEVNADVVLWPITYQRAQNDLITLYAELESDHKRIIDFLLKSGFRHEELSVSAPAVTDKLAQDYGSGDRIKYRYNATQTLTIYTTDIDLARRSMTQIAELGKEGITFLQYNYENHTEFLFTNLNEVKPEMIREATSNARSAAQQFAADSQSSLGKIKSAQQGQFTITPRDSNTPHIMKVRVVSTVEYYLSD